MTFHDVAYVHDCPKTGGRELRMIQYDNAEHEFKNLSDPKIKEHVCPHCKQPMARLGAASEIKAPDAAKWLAT